MNRTGAEQTNDEPAVQATGVQVIERDQPIGSRYEDPVLLLQVPKAEFERFFSRSGASDRDNEGRLSPLSVQDFREVLSRVDELGWAWTADDPPALEAKGSGREPDGEGLRELSRKYPEFPTELAVIIKFVLFGRRPSEQIAGPPHDVDAKAELVSKLVLTDKYRDAFFFQHATKIRRFYDLDWEVNVKAAERNVRRTPRSVYAVLSLYTCEKPPDSDEQIETIAFAADERALRRMFSLLQEVLAAVEEARGAALDGQHGEASSHDTDSSRRQP